MKYENTFKGSRWDRYLGMTAAMTQVPVPTATSSSTLIERLGFFDAGNQDWNDFESFNKSVVYDFGVRDYDIIELIPNHVGYTHDINKSRILDL